MLARIGAGAGAGLDSLASRRRQPACRSGCRAGCAGAAGTDYIVGPQDVLNVRIYGEDKLSGKIRIDNDGSFPFEYLGRVKAEGMTTAQIETYLAKALGDGYLRNPQVSVEVIEYRSQSVFVTGEVRSPNKYMLPGNSTLMDVLTLAGSVTPNAGNWVQITHARQGAEVLGPYGVGRLRHARESARHSDRQGAEHQDARRRHDLRAEGRTRLGRRPGAQSSGALSTRKG